jgi:flavin reductase (DIM6/NTAB) family NADH-FMN oxidoreductase RutF
VSRNEHEMRSVMGHFATGVCVVSTSSPDGVPEATTVNAVTSVSLEPPLLLVCLARESETLAALSARSHFVVNVLAERQREHSVRFARKGDQAATHEVHFARHHLDLPCLPGALATIACRVSAVHPGGDHMVVIGEALAMSHAERDATPLLFFRGAYSRLESERSFTPPTVRRRVAALEHVH